MRNVSSETRLVLIPRETKFGQDSEYVRSMLVFLISYWGRFFCRFTFTLLHNIDYAITLRHAWSFYVNFNVTTPLILLQTRLCASNFDHSSLLDKRRVERSSRLANNNDIKN